jgi:aspartate/glutamate/aspartate-prephenate aminotransferase
MTSLTLASSALFPRAADLRAHPLRRAPVMARASIKRGAAVASVDQSLNPRVASLRESKTMALTDLARSMKESGLPVIGLAAGEPDFDTPAAIVEAGCAAIRGGKTRYSPNTGTASLREAVCKKLLEENGVQYAPHEIVLSNGAKQSVAQGVIATCGPGDEVIVPAPYWVSYPEMCRLAGAEPVVVQTTVQDGFLLSAETLRKSLTPKSRLLILCSPSNPSGAVYSEEALRSIADVVREHPRLLVLADEIYEHIIYPPAKHVSFAGLPEMRERTLTVNGFSKAFAMTGWRLGYLAAPAHFAKATATIQGQTTSGPSTISQEAGLAALQLGPNGGEPVAEMKAAFLKRRDYVVKRFKEMRLNEDDIKLDAPQGAFYVFPDVGNIVGEGCVAEGFGPVNDGDDFCRYLLEKAQVALVPGSAFGNPECVRLSYAASDDTLAEALDRVEKALKEDVYRVNKKP